MILRTTIYLSLLFISFSVTEIQAEKKVIDRIIASVNQESISEFELNTRARLDPNQDLDTTLKQLILEKLVWQEARAHQIKISDQETNSYIELLARGQGITAEEFLAQRKQESYPEKLFREQVKVEIAKRKLIGKLFQNSLDIDESEIDSYIKNNPQMSEGGNKVKLRVLFLNQTKHTAEEIVKLESKIQNKLSQGEDFAVLAKKYSDDPSSVSGGDIGIVSEEDLNSDFLDALRSVQEDGHTKSIKSKRGVHILKIDERFTNENQDQSNLREFARNKIKQEKLEKKIAEYFSKDIQEKHLIEIK